MLASFLVTKKARPPTTATTSPPPTATATDTETPEPAPAKEIEYFQPITLMVEVAYGREEILNCIRRWVKPVEEVVKHMEATMERCTRAPTEFLALRLPVRGTEAALSSAEEERLNALATKEALVLEEGGKVKKERKAPAKPKKKDGVAAVGGVPGAGNGVGSAGAVAAGGDVVAKAAPTTDAAGQTPVVAAVEGAPSVPATAAGNLVAVTAAPAPTPSVPAAAPDATSSKPEPATQPPTVADAAPSKPEVTVVPKVEEAKIPETQAQPEASK
jgi:hypothetical protein